MERLPEVRWRCLPQRYTFSRLHPSLSSESGFRNGISNVDRVACESPTDALKRSSPLADVSSR